jgi:uncharacterized membrane protein YbaN (DUF454 family)/N-acetylglutamate synthase-like GNAT family acetyltransferase
VPDLPSRPVATPSQRAHRRWLLLALGWSCFALGAVGAVLPLIPTTPLMLVALWAFSSSSERFHDWLYGHRVFGPPLQRWQRERVLPLWVKLVAVTSMAASFAYAALGARAPWYALAAMGAVMLFGVAYISRIPSRPRGAGAPGAGEVRYEDATAADLPAILALLEALGLPTADVGGAGQLFLVARANGAVVGCVALEPHGADVLLRSLAVSPARQGNGIGRVLHAQALARASALGLRTVYLLTTSAERLFAREGYARIDRSAVPAAIRATAEFAALCPASAACMCRSIE